LPHVEMTDKPNATRTKPSQNALVAAKGMSPEVLIAQAIERNVPVETMEKLLAMRRELKGEQAKEAFNAALSAFQAECPVIRKGKPVFNKDKSIRYVYAPLEAIVEQVKPLLQRHGFSFTVDSAVEENWVGAVCKVTHQLGHSETSTFKVPVDRDAFMSAPQRFASARRGRRRRRSEGRRAQARGGADEEPV
jgi:hypothetical protein